jgi:hypothetical protein
MGRIVRFASSVVCLAVLLSASAFGAGEVRAIGAIALLATAGGFVAGFRRWRAERADGPAPSTVFEYAQGTALVWAGLTAYYLFVFLVLLPSDLGSTAIWSLACGIAVVIGLVSSGVSQYRQGGLERQVLLEATSIGFFVTLAAVGLATVAGDRLAVSPVWFWYAGVAAWWGTTMVRTRQLLQ